MKYAGMPFDMWTLFAPSFQKQLTAVFGNPLGGICLNTLEEFYTQ